MVQEERSPRGEPEAPQPGEQSAPGPEPVDPGADTIEAEPGSSKGSGGHSSAESQRLRCREFGDYEIISEVARGAMGIVYRARHKRLDRVVALKVLLAGEHASEAEIRRFTREALALARLKHPNIVPIYDIGEVGGRHFFTMDFVEGTTLSKVLLERQLTATESLGIIEQIADAVAAAHGRGVIHRDVKPSNIMLDPEGGVHIMDFGLSKSSTTDSKHTRDGTTIGTPAYMSPEQAKGEISKVDERSDIYSMGAVLYEMLAGRPPFGGTNLLEIVLAVINEDPPRLRAVNPRVPRELEVIVQKAMEKSPERRYRTAAELREEVRRYRSGEPIRARPASLWYLAGKKTRKHWAALTTSASVGVLVGLAVVGYLYYRSSQKAKQQLEARVQEYVEGSQPEWRPDPKFASADLQSGWEPRQFRGEVLLDPQTGEDRTDLRTEWSARVSKEMIYISGQVRLEFELQGPMSDQVLGLGFVGEPLPCYCYFRMRSGRLELMAAADPDRQAAGAPVPVIADRQMPVLEPGRRYAVTFAREGIRFSFKLSGPGGAELASLSCAHAGFSNYRYRNLRLLVRAPDGLLRVTSLEVNRQLTPKHPSQLFAADKVFNRGDYNGACEEYEAILAGTPPRDDPERLAERAMAQLRMGLYYELKRDLDPDYVQARRRYDEARRLAELVPGGGANEELQRCLAEAQGRQLVVTGWALRDKLIGAEVFTKLLDATARSGPAALRGPWALGLGPLVGELAAAGQLDPARNLAKVLDPPAGSLLFARSYAALGRALVAAGSHREVPALAGRCPERPLAAPLAEAIARGAGGQDLEWALGALKSGRQSRLLASGSQATLDALRSICDAGARRHDFVLVKDAIYEASGDGSLSQEFRELISNAVASAVSRAADDPADSKKTREQALQLLSLAAGRMGTADSRVSMAALVLGGKYCKAREYSAIGRLYSIYPAVELADVYAEAAAGLISSSPADALVFVEEARNNWPGLVNPKLADAAVRAGQSFAKCETPEDERGLLRAYEVWPGPGHLDNFVLAMDSLAGEKVKKKRFGTAGEVLAFVRIQGLFDARVVERTVAAIEAARKKPEDLAAFMRPLAAVETALAGQGQDAQLADWRLELAGYQLLAGNLGAVGDAYERVHDQREKLPAAAAKADLRHGLLLALQNQPRPAAGKLNNARRLAEGLRGAEATAFAARGAVEKDLDLAAFRRESEENRLLSPAELELVLAARAALAGDAKTAAERLSAASKALTGKVWPYELVKTESARLSGT
jgi:serine/threonine protein kinase